MGLQGIATLGHPYVTMRTYTLAFSVANTSTLATKPATVTIVSAMLAPDPQAPGQTALFVGTSAAFNNILLAQSPGGSVSVFLTSPPYYGVFTPSAGGHLYVYATTGSNSVTIGRTVTHDSVVYATGPGDDTIVDDGSGNDCLYGGGRHNTIRAGSGSDVLVGGGLMSFLFGGPGRDVLIGGLGQSFLYGGRGDDLMIAGTTAYDANDAALTAILNEWASGDSFATRMGRLDGAIGGGANGAYLLTAGAGGTVQANGARNCLLAGSGQNWFFAHLGPGLYSDIVVKKPSDTVTLI
jgi:Ca2+-binding RTX toxin-like protein